MLMRNPSVVLLALLMTIPMCFGAGLESLKPGVANLESAGVLAFGPEGVLFVGDSQAGAIWALDTADREPGSGAVNLDAVDTKIAGALGLTPDRILINDMAINPISKKAYLSVSRGRGPDAAAVILSVDASGKIAELSLSNIPHSVAKLENPVSADAKEFDGKSFASLRERCSTSMVRRSPARTSCSTICRIRRCSDRAWSASAAARNWRGSGGCIAWKIRRKRAIGSSLASITRRPLLRRAVRS